MVDTLKDDTTLLGELDTSGFRTTDVQTVRDAIYSKAQGGVMYCSDQTATIQNTFTECPFFTASADTKGVTENLAAGKFTVSDADGDAWSFAASVLVKSPAAGAITFQFAKNGTSLLPYRMKRVLVADEETLFTLFGGQNLNVNDTVGLAWDGSGSASIEIIDAQFRIVKA